MLKPMILLASKVAEDRVFAEEAAGAAGFDLVMTDDPQEARTRVLPDGRTILLVGVDNLQDVVDFKSHFGEVIGEGSGKLSPCFVHLIGTCGEEEISEISESNLFANYVLRMPDQAAEAGRYYGRIIHQVSLKKDTELDGIVPPPGQVESVRLNHSSDRAKALDQIQERLKARGDVHERVIHTIINAIDELLMNAIYDAPSDEGGDQKFRKVARTVPIDLTGKHTVELRMFLGADYLAFTVIDSFGSLKRNEVLKHVLRGYELKKYEAGTQAGAGIGLANTFHVGGSLLFVSELGQKTEATVVFRKTGTYKEFKKQFRFISIRTHRA